MTILICETRLPEGRAEPGNTPVEHHGTEGGLPFPALDSLKNKGKVR
jgi:hypothetical protein